MLFRWFAEERVDLAVVEVGLGGRLDATHAWDGGVAAITNVALDHMAWLGPTVPAIAREKAAIIERGDLAVTGASGEALRGHPAPGAAASARRSRRSSPPPLLGWDRDGLDVELARPRAARGSGSAAATRPRTRRSRMPCWTRSARPGIATVPDDARRRGYARPAGRAGSSCCASAAARCSSTAPTTRPARPRSRPPSTTCDRSSRAAMSADPAPLTLVHGSMADKDVDGIIAALARAAARCATRRIIATQVPGARALPAAELAAAVARPAPGSAASRRSPDVGPRRSTGRSAGRAVRSSWPGRCTSSARRGGAGSTTRCSRDPEEPGP